VTRFAGTLRKHLVGIRAGFSGLLAGASNYGRVARAGSRAALAIKIGRGAWRSAAVRMALAVCFFPGGVRAATVAEIARDQSPNRQRCLKLAPGARAP
jgi:hypothetical protein